MKKRYRLITTVGISIKSNYEREAKKFYTNELCKEKKEKIFTWLLGVDSRKASAELNSIQALLSEDMNESPLNKQDLPFYDVDFICTDDDLCYLMAEILQDYCRARLSDRINISSIQRVKNLQVKDAQLFLNSGVVELQSTIERLTTAYEASEIKLNITAGYKAFIPYLTIMAQMRGYELVYLYETTTKLIRIPPVINIDMTLYKEMLNNMKRDDD